MEESKFKIVNNMGSVRHRFDEVRHDCNVVLVGDVRVGKSALVNRFIHNKFSEVSNLLVLKSFLKNIILSLLL